MKRYLVEYKFDQEKKNPEELMKQPKLFAPVGEGTILIGGDLEDSSYSFLVIECKDTPEEFLSDLARWVSLTIRPILLCPTDCDKCPPFTIPPLRGTQTIAEYNASTL